MSRTNFGTDVMHPGQQPPGMVPGYSAGGAIDENIEESPMMNTMGARMQVDINAALGAINNVMSYGRKMHGLGGEQHAAPMPGVPFNETPKPQPMPGHIPLPPGQKPFGKRVENEGDEGAIDVAGVIPSVPFSETPKPQPMPGPLPPTSNPFGKRADASEEGTQPSDDGAIPTDDEEVA